jgi:hypothetical protein
MSDNLIDISSDMTPEFFKEESIVKGRVLIFSQDGEKKAYRIVRLNRKECVCKVVETRLYTKEEIDNIAGGKHE